MNQKLKTAFDERMDLAKSFYAQGEMGKAFAALEQAHILGQAYVKPHVLVHYWMLKVGLKKGDYNEVLGQLVRLPLGIVGSLRGTIPVGNTGGANIGMFKSLPIPTELKAILDSDEADKKNPKN